MAEQETVRYRIEADVSDLKRGLDQVKRELQQNEAQVRSLGAAFQRVGGTITGAISGLKGVFAALGVGKLTLELIQQVDAYRLLTARIDTALGVVGRGPDIFRALANQVRGTAVSIDAASDVFLRLARTSKELNLNEQQLLNTTEAITKAAALSGSSFASTQGALIQLGQAFASGRLGGEEFRSVTEQIPRVAQAIADALGITIGKLRELSIEQKLTGRVLALSFQSQLPVLRREIESLPKTLETAFNDLRTTFAQAIADLVKSGRFDPVIDKIKELGESFKDPAFKQAIIDITGGIADFGKAIAEFLPDLVRFLELIDNFGNKLNALSSGKNPFDVFREPGFREKADKALAEQSIGALEKQLSRTDLPEPTRERLNKQLEETKARVAELNTALKELAKTQDSVASKKIIPLEPEALREGRKLADEQARAFQEQARAELAAADARAEADKEAKRLAKEREREAKRAAEEAARLAEARAQAVADIQLEVRQQQQLFDALKISEEAFRATEIAITAVNAARQASIDPASEQGKVFIAEAEAAQRLADAQDELRESRERAATVKDAFSDVARDVTNLERLIEAQGRGKEAAEAVELAIRAETEARQLNKDATEAELEALEQDILRREQLAKVADANRQALSGRQDDLDDILLEPFKQLASSIAQLASDGFEEFLKTGKLSVTELGNSINDILRKATAGLFGNLLTQPLNSFIDNIRDQFQGKDGKGFAGLLQFAQDRPLTFGTGIGAIAGQFVPALTGQQPTAFTGIGGSLGGLAGAAIGNAFLPGIGGAVGGLLGGVAGSFLGGLFGGGANLGNDRAVLDYFPTVGVSWQDKNSSQENRRFVNNVADQLSDVDRLLRRSGAMFPDEGSSVIRIEAGNKSGFKVNGVEVRTEAEAIQEAIRQQLDQLARIPGDTLKTVLENTEAKSAQELGQDIDFAKMFDRLVDPKSAFGEALATLKEQFADAAFRAEELGLNVDKLTKAQAEAEADLREDALRGVNELINPTSDYMKMLVQLRDSYKEAKKTAKDLGMATGDLDKAQKDAEERLRQDALRDYRNLVDPGSGFRQALEALQDRFRTAKELAEDLGLSIGDLNKAQAKAEKELRDQAMQDLAQLIDPASGFKQAMLDLEDRFKQARKLAADLGIDVPDLEPQRQRQIRELREQALRDLADLVDPGRSEIAQGLADIRERFRQAAILARDLGIAIDELNEKQRKAERDFLDAAERDVKKQLSDQADQIRSFFDNVLGGYNEVLGFGGVASSFTSGRAQLNQGLDEFRKQLALAQGGDVDAATNLPALASQLLQTARDFGASGPEFAKIFNEVNKGLVSVQRDFEKQRDDVLKSIPETARQTAAEQIAALKEGFAELVAKLEEIRKERALLGPAADMLMSLAAANQNVIPTQLGAPWPIRAGLPEDMIGSSPGEMVENMRQIGITQLKVHEVSQEMDASLKEIPVVIKIGVVDQIKVLQDGFERMVGKLEEIRRDRALSKLAA